MTYSGSPKVLQGGGDANADNVCLVTMRLLEVGTNSFALGRDNSVDVFNDTAGVNALSSTNEVHDNTNKLYSGTVVQAEIGGGAAGNISFGDAVAESKHVGMRFASTYTGAISSVTVTVGSLTVAFDSVCSFYTVAVGFPPKPNTGAQVGGNSSTLNLGATGVKTYTWASNAPSLTSGTNYYVVFSDSGTSGNVTLMTVAAAGGQYRTDADDTLADVGADQYATDLMLAIKSKTNMTLVSAIVNANSQPGRARLLMVYDPVDSTTPNTDLKGYVSRDGGSTYTQVTFVGQSIYSGTKKMLVGEADISGQPAGTTMVYKIETLNTKEININNASMSWS